MTGDYLEENEYVGTWGETFSSTDITGGKRINRPSKTPNETEDGFANFDDAVAYAHISIVSQKANGGVILKVKERYYAYTIKVEARREFSRQNLEESFDTLDTSKSKAQNIQAFITTDGYAAPPTEFESSEKPAYIVERNQVGRTWQSTKDAKESGYETILQDLADGRNVEINEQGYVALFKGLLKAKALKILDENRQRLVEGKAQYSSDNSKSPQNLKYLREVIKKDQQLADTQIKSQNQRNDNYNQIENLKPKPGEVEPPDSSRIMRLLEQDIKSLDQKIKAITQVRVTLRTVYPALAAPDVDKSSDSTSDAVLVEKIGKKFDQVLSAIEKVYTGVHEDDIPFDKLEPIVAETLQQMGISKDAQDPKSKAVLTLLKNEETKEGWINLLGFLTTLGLGIAAFFTKGTTSEILGLLGSGVGLGTAGYEFERADDLYGAAQAGELAGKPLVNDPEAARFNYIMGWVNLALAGLDFGVAFGSGATPLKSAERVANLDSTGVISKLQPEEIKDFDEVMQLQRTGNTKEAQAKLDEIKNTLKAKFPEEGEQIFAQAKTVFQRTSLPPEQVSELNGFKGVLPNGVRDKVSIQVDSTLPLNTVQVHYELDDRLVSNIYMLVGPKAKVRDIQLHVPTVRLMQRYSGLKGRLRVLLERIQRWLTQNGEPIVGTLGWEAKLEIEKLPRIIQDRIQLLARNTLDEQAKIDGLIEIEDLTEQLSKYERILSRIDETPGLGFVAAQKEGRWIRTNKGKISEVKPGGQDAFYVTNEQYDVINKLPKNQRQTREEIFENLPENLRQEVQPTQAIKKVVEEPKLSNVRSDYLGEYKNVKLGQELGSGGNKDVYSVQGREDLAIGILREGSIDELIGEIEELQKLASEGLQTIEVLGTTTHNNRPAIVMKKYAQGSKDIVRLQDGKVRRVDGGNIRLLNQNSIQDLNIIRSVMVRNKIRIDDLQFMLASDGHVYITDPIKVIIGGKAGTKQNNLDMIDLLIDAAQQNILERGR